MSLKTTTVPCNGCTLCCRGELIVLHPEEGDDPSRYDTVMVHSGGEIGDVFALKNKANGDCIYLGESGCTIHDRRPLVCRAYDCRDNYLTTPRHKRRRMIAEGLASKAIFNRGRELLKGMKDHD